jgi:5-methyltetrahydrofolate--homocysteine methyltransferase
MTRTADATSSLLEKARQRILVLDGAMGTMIQGLGLSETDFRGTRFADHCADLQGDNDLLVLTQSDKIRAIHRQYLDAGADIILTNTFNGTSISQGDYAMESVTEELNRVAAQLACEARDAFVQERGEQRWVAGSLGPTNRTLSISPDVNNPAFRALSFDELKNSYAEQARGLVMGGCDLLLVETIFDTLNSKAAIVAIQEVLAELERSVPLWISVTVTDRSGRTLSGQTLEAFWTSVAHARPICVGLNCALGAEHMRPYLEEIARLSPTLVSCHPNAGLPNAFGEYDQTPETTGRLLGEFARDGLVNIVGGCCGPCASHPGSGSLSCSSLPPLSGRDVLQVQRPGNPDDPAGEQFPDGGRAHQRYWFHQVSTPDHEGPVREGPGRGRRSGSRRRQYPRRQHGRWHAGRR